MSEMVTIDETGRILIPQSMRDEMKLSPKQQLELQFRDGELTLRPKSQGKIVEKNGMYVWTGEIPNDATEDLIEQIREERIDSILENI